MNYSRHIPLIIAAVAILHLSTGEAAEARVRSVPTGETLTWHDGKISRTLTVSPDLLMEFPRPDDASESLPLLAPGMRQIKSGRGVRLWQIPAQTSLPALSSSLRSTDASLRLSPVFYSQTGRMMALPGNIIVRFPSQWDEAKITAWQQAHALLRLRTLQLKNTYYVYQTEAGLAALELAETIRQEGEVVAVFPDWWKEISFR